MIQFLIPVGAAVGAWYLFFRKKAVPQPAPNYYPAPQPMVNVAPAPQPVAPAITPTAPSTAPAAQVVIAPASPGVSATQAIDTNQAVLPPPPDSTPPPPPPGAMDPSIDPASALQTASDVAAVAVDPLGAAAQAAGSALVSAFTGDKKSGEPGTRNAHHHRGK